MSDSKEEQFKDCNESEKINNDEKKEEKDQEDKNVVLQEQRKDKDIDGENSSDEEDIKLSEEEKTEIINEIIKQRKVAGSWYKEGNYVEALNIYSMLWKKARRIKNNEQLVVLYCNKGICFNKLNDKDKALESFTNAWEINNSYSKALANRFLLHNSKGNYIEALEDYTLLKKVDKNLWNNYSSMEWSLQQNAELKKKQMTDEMLGKWKEMGNSILGNFGISLDNFHMQPNAQGGYSIQYDNKK